jgi:hypothetical protein
VSRLVETLPAPYFVDEGVVDVLGVERHAGLSSRRMSIIVAAVLPWATFLEGLRVRSAS